MSDFLQSLVLRAAGLPLAASAAPRLDSAPVEDAEEMPPEHELALPPESEEDRAAAGVVWASRPPLVNEKEEGARGGLEAHTTPAADGAFGEEPAAVTDEERQPQRAQPPLPVSTTPTAPPPQIIERETIIERELQREPRPIPPPQLIPQPAPPPIQLPGERIVEREHKTTTPIAAEAPAAPPVILQPIVIDQTRTIVEPVREERTLVETRTERIRDEQTITTQHDNDRETAPPPQTIVEPRQRLEVHPHQQLAPEPISEPRHTEPAAAEEQPERDSAPPRTLVLPPPPAPPHETAEREESAPQPELQIHIGTIEIRAAAPPPPPATPPPAVIQHVPEPPSHFDDYAAVRNYIFPDVWR